MLSHHIAFTTSDCLLIDEFMHRNLADLERLTVLATQLSAVIALLTQDTIDIDFRVKGNQNYHVTRCAVNMATAKEEFWDTG